MLVTHSVVCMHVQHMRNSVVPSVTYLGLLVMSCPSLLLLLLLQTLLSALDGMTQGDGS